MFNCQCKVWKEHTKNMNLQLHAVRKNQIHHKNCKKNHCPRPVLQSQQRHEYQIVLAQGEIQMLAWVVAGPQFLQPLP